jgi:hypothetical protein
MKWLLAKPSSLAILTIGPIHDELVLIFETKPADSQSLRGSDFLGISDQQ